MYGYQEWLHPVHTASLHIQKVERREHGYTERKFFKFFVQRTMFIHI